jgi:Serine aminopeptidase, S33
MEQIWPKPRVSRRARGHHQFEDQFLQISLTGRATKQRLSTTNQETVEGGSGLKIFFRSWRPGEKAHAIVVIVPGFNAHSGYYEWVAEQFVADGLAAYALDRRGRGKALVKWDTLYS